MRARGVAARLPSTLKWAGFAFALLYLSRRKGRPTPWTTALLMGGVIRLGWNARRTRRLAYFFSPIVRIRRRVALGVPVDLAFRWWTEFSNFPKFMSYVSDVQVNDSGGISWRMAGPGGIPFFWQAAIKRMVTNRVFEWQSLPGLPIKHKGLVHFYPDPVQPEKASSIEVELSYSAPIGVMGYGLVKLLGFNPEERIDGDLLEMKRLLETEYSSASDIPNTSMPASSRPA